MQRYIRSTRILFFLFLAASSLFGTIVLAQEMDRGLDDLAKHASKEIAKARVGSIFVADFVSNDGALSIQGKYLADEFAERIDRHKKNFSVIERKRFTAALTDAKLSISDLSTASSLQRIGDSLQAEAIVTGTFETTTAQYSLKITVHRLRDDSNVFSGDKSIKRPGYVDGMVLLDPDGPGQRIARAGVDGVSIPACVYCPPPSYTDKARAEKVQAIVVLLVVITEGGRAGRMAVIKANDDGLARNAIYAVREWKFKPATNKEGKPVAVITPIEVSFSIY